MTTGLVILDMLGDFVDGVLANPAAKPIIDPIARLADAARGRDGWVVLYANDAHQPGDFEFAVFGEHAIADSPGAQVVPQLRPESDDLIVPKRSYSAFADTDLDTTCRVLDIDHLVLVGQHTDCCCRHTAYDAFRRGIAVTVVDDATCVFQPMGPTTVAQRQQAALGYLRDFYAADLVESRDLVNG